LGRRDRQCDAEGGKRGESEQSLSHTGSPLELNPPSMRKGLNVFQNMF